ncbi:hypothetical protein ILYODFUR_023457 [Ilyodon furcidens]|uniref:Uncharacterized protein n=1 Tax=Ilyodon furcidens TaxID=33524 RepID=A0ABV0SZI3_9TELE
MEGNSVSVTTAKTHIYTACLTFPESLSLPAFVFIIPSLKSTEHVVGVGMVRENLLQFLHSSPLLSVFLSAVEFKPFFLWSEAHPSVCPFAQSRTLFLKRICVCMYMWLSGWV